MFEAFPGDVGKVDYMSLIAGGEVRTANICCYVCSAINGVSELHSQIIKDTVFHDFYLFTPEKFKNVTNGIAYRRWLLQSNPRLCEFLDKKIGTEYKKNAYGLKKLEAYKDDSRVIEELLKIKHKNKVDFAQFLKDKYGEEINPDSIFDVQVKRLHEYKRQLMNILHVMYLYNQLKKNPNMKFYPRTFIFGAKAAAGYLRAKQTIKLINSVADKVNNDASIKGKLKVVFIEDYRVSNAEWIFAAADVSEQISTASKEASGTGNMKFMLNGAPTLGTMDGANVEIVDEVGAENAFIFGMSSEEVINYENNGGYHPYEIYENDKDIHEVLDQLVDGTYADGDHELYKDLYQSLLFGDTGSQADMYFILKDFRSYAEAHEKVAKAYQDTKKWAKMAMTNTAGCGKFSSDRTIQEYVDDIWHLDKIR